MKNEKDVCGFEEYEGKELNDMPTQDSTDVDSNSLDRKIILKLDLLIIPLVTIVYLLAFLDRANIGNARVAGLQRDLKLTDLQYQTAITVTYVPYIASEIPSNLIIKKIGPRVHISSLCFFWGLITTLQSQVHNYAGLLACRFFLGLMEGGLFPGIILYLSGFYCRKELSFRVAMFFAAASLSGAFSGLLAAAISKMSGLAGMEGWRWVFCLEGIMTTCWAVIVFLLLPNNPAQVRLFNLEEAERCSQRLRADVDLLEDEKVTPKKVLSVFRDVHVILVWICSTCAGCLIFGLAYFTPSIVHALGYTPIRTQLMTVPPYALAFVLSLLVAYFSDRFSVRGIPMIFTLLLSLIGLIMFYIGRSLPVRYTALFFMIGGAYSNAPCLCSWAPNNTAGYARRATAVAMVTVCNNIGGLISTWIFPQSDAPYYSFGAKFMLSMNCIYLVSTALTMWIYARANRKKTTATYRQKVLENVSHLSFARQLEEVGDAHPDYKYLL